VTLLGSGNDIDKKRIREDFMAYDMNENYKSLKIKGNSGRYLDFGHSNAFILTNAIDGEKECIDERSDPKKFNQDDSDASGLSDQEETEIDLENPTTRKDFRETWIFEELKADENGEFELKSKVPDTITSFFVTGFAIHPEKGLAIANQRKVTVAQEFFVKLFLPFSIRFGEVLKVEVTVFNYISKPRGAASVEVELFNDDATFEFIDVDRSCKITRASSEELFRTKTITVPEDGGEKTFFHIRALQPDPITIKVRASTSRKSDEVEKTLQVESEGITEFENKPFLIDLRHKLQHSFLLNQIFAPGFIPKSVYIEASAIGNILGPALENIQELM
jgi:CD109 antigen